MHITTIDDKKDLFEVRDLIPIDILEAVNKIDLDQVPYDKMGWLEFASRKALQPLDGSAMAELQNYIKTLHSVLSDSLGFKVHSIESTFWLDSHNFTFPAHIDNPGIESAMQIYLNDCPNTGTTFYQVEPEEIEDKDDSQKWYYKGDVPPQTIRHQFAFEKNNGYIMINHRTQLHGMDGKLNASQRRFSLYCWLN
jgi:hypothetical protein